MSVFLMALLGVPAVAADDKTTSAEASGERSAADAKSGDKVSNKPKLARTGRWASSSV